MNEMKHGPAAPDEPTALNIDLECMNSAENVFKNIKGDKAENPERAINEAIAVLKENGLYALVIYLEANFKKDKNNNPQVTVYSRISEGIQAFGKIMKAWSGEDLRKNVRDLSSTDNIFNLFFVVDVVEQMLIYLRYLAKGLPKASDKHSGKSDPTAKTEKS